LGFEPGRRGAIIDSEVEPAGCESPRDSGGEKLEDGQGEERNSRPPENFFWVSRVVQAIYCVLGVVEGLIIIRVLFKALAANPNGAFAQFTYAVTVPLVFPFVGMFAEPKLRGAVFELSSVLALVVYVFFAWAVARLIWQVHPGRRC
jgi:hypothetical protein